MSERPTFPVGINVLVVNEGKLLLGKRKGSAGEGSWGLPGGHLEPGENMLDAAARELKEETSLEAEKFTFANLVNLNGDISPLHYLQVAFTAENITSEVKLAEPEFCSEWRWFPLEALPEDIFFGCAKNIGLFLKKLPFADGKLA